MIWDSISKTTNIFWRILGSTYWLQSTRKKDTRNFYLFVYLRRYNDESKISFFFEQYSQGATCFVCEWAYSAENTSMVFSSSIPLYIEKNLVEKMCMVLEMELATYTPFGLKFVFEKIKVKVLHYTTWFHSPMPRTQQTSE